MILTHRKKVTHVKYFVFYVAIYIPHCLQNRQI